MKTLYLATITILVLVISSTSIAYAQSSYPVSTSLAKVNVGLLNMTENSPTLVISGIVYKAFSQNIVLTIFDPQNRLISVSQLQPRLDGTFSQSIIPSDPLWPKGNYTVRVASGSQNLTENVFYFPGIGCCKRIITPGVQGHLNSSTNPLSPLKQFKSGIAAKDVKCKEGLQIIMKNENGQPACVTPHTFDELMTRGWGTIPLGELSTYHNTSNDIGISYNNTLYVDGAFHVKQGQNFTLMLNVTSNHANVPVTLYTAPHSGFTKTNGIDFKLSDTLVNAPAKVMLYMSVSKDATPSTYGEAVRLNDTDLGSVTYLFYVTVTK